MQMRDNPESTDVAFFPFRLWESGNDGNYLTINHHMVQPIKLDTQAAEVLRLADGATSFIEIIERLIERYPDAGGAGVIGPRVTELLRMLTAKGLIWWREVPVQPVPVHVPSSIFWEVTSACNLQCLHCVVDAGRKIKGELSTERCFTLAEELAASGVQDVAFSGGEPLLHPDFFEIAEKVRKLGMNIQLATNGTLVTPQVARALMDLDANVQVSLDGSTPEIHDVLRPGQNAFMRSIEGIKALVAAGHQITIGTVLSTVNINDIPAIVELAEQLGAATFRLIPFIPKGRGEFHRDMEVPPSQVKEVVRFLHNMRGRRRINFAPLEFEEMLDGGVCPDYPSPDMSLKCGGAVVYATITPNGEVLPCHFFEGVRADNVQSHAFSDIWYRSRFLNYFRHLTVSDLYGNCSTCTWLYRCTGSCRAGSHAKGDIFAGNKACWVSPETTTRNA